ncbi:MAG: hypothetical protein JW384_00207 [Nitrosomonadaceae bacterium]|nr:hypothetical protein [Nitrosomonadaceae bacterium]
MANASVKDCVGSIKELKHLSADAAKLLLSDIKKRARSRAELKFLSKTDALKEIADELIVGSKFEIARKKRNSLLSLRSIREKVEFAEKNNHARGLEMALENVKSDFHGLYTKNKAEVDSMIEENGLIPYIRSRTPAEDLAIRKEWKNLTLGESASKSSVSGDEQAFKLARILFDKNAELVALNNRHGASILQAEGWSGSQTHLPEKMWAAGRKRFGRNVTEAQVKQTWMDFMNGMNIDWGRMDLGGVDREKWLANFFRNVFTTIHAEDKGITRMPAEIDFHSNGKGPALADKLSSSKSLWFKDAESEQAYDMRFGRGDAFDTAMVSIREKSRSAALMMNMGPDPDMAFKVIKSELLNSAKDLPNSTYIIGLLKQPHFDRQFQSLTGQSASSVLPWMSRITEYLKATTLLSKGSKFVIAAIGDKWAMDTAMGYHGATSADRYKLALEGMAIRTRQGGGKALRDLYDISQSFAHEMSMMSADAHLALNSRVLGKANKAIEGMFKWTGFEGVTTAHHRAPAYAYARMVARDAEHAYANLPDYRLRDFEEHGITPAEWDAWRKQTKTFSELGGPGDDLVLTPDMAQFFSETDWNRIVTENGDKVSPSTLNRAKDNLDRKFRGLFASIIAEANNDPTLRVQSMKSVAGPKGSLSGEAMDMFMMFKSFSLTQVDRHLNREYARTGSAGLREYLKENPYGAMKQASWLVAKSLVAGLTVIWVNDLISGRTPKAVWNTEENKPNMDVIMSAIARGGGLGIYGDFLFNEYDRRYRSVADAALGPILGQASVGVDIWQDVKEGVTPSYKALKAFQDNAPFINMPFIKPVFDHLIFWQLQEALNPGIQSRRADAMRREGVQSYNPMFGPLSNPEESVAQDPLGVQELFK